MLCGKSKGKFTHHFGFLLNLVSNSFWLWLVSWSKELYGSSALTQDQVLVIITIISSRYMITAIVLFVGTHCPWFCHLCDKKVEQSNHTIPGVISVDVDGVPSWSQHQKYETGLLGSDVHSPVSKAFDIIMFCVLLVVLFLWWYPSCVTSSREGALNQQERWTNYLWWF